MIMESENVSKINLPVKEYRAVTEQLWIILDMQDNRKQKNSNLKSFTFAL